MKKYKALFKIRGKKGRIFEWDRFEGCYTTNSMAWFLTPLIDRSEMQARIKLKQFKRL